MTVYAITDTKKGRTGIAPTYLQTTRYGICCDFGWYRCIYTASASLITLLIMTSLLHHSFHYTLLYSLTVVDIIYINLIRPIQ